MNAFSDPSPTPPFPSPTGGDGQLLELDPTAPLRIGSYLLTRPLGHSPIAARFLALHEQTQSSHVAHRLAPCPGRVERARMEAAFTSLARLDHPHILRLESLTIVDDTPWIITPFAGDADGLRSLGKLLRQKGGQMSPLEAGIAVGQLLAAFDYAHARSAEAPVFNGGVTLDDVLVDRHGRVIVELFGFSRRLKGMARGDMETIREEVARIVEIGYELITGLRAEEPVIPAQRLAPRLSRSWAQWLERGLDPSLGFRSAKQALEALPTSAPVQTPAVVVRREMATLARR